MNVAGNATMLMTRHLRSTGVMERRRAAILINGGNYNVGGTFLTYIDGNGAITFNNASAHADVLKAGVFGANGVLNIGGGTLSADTTLKLYAPGSNGQLNFVSNVTLGGNSAKILAANSITIFDNVVVTIGGKAPADVYTNNPNYSGRGAVMVPLPGRLLARVRTGHGHSRKPRRLMLRRPVIRPTERGSGQ